MSRKELVGAVAGLSLGLIVTTTAIPTFASGHGHGIAGKITRMSGTSVQVQTTAGLVTEQLTSGTRVTKVTQGSLSDLTPGTFATVTLTAGTNSVTAVRVGSKVGTAGHPRSGTHPAHPIRVSNGGTTSKPHTGSHQGGQIISATNGELVLRNRQGQTTTYTLGQNVSVTKIVSSQVRDLAIGETVRIAARPGSTTALAVIIESA
jgi:hypothetical protein